MSEQIFKAAVVDREIKQLLGLPLREDRRTPANVPAQLAEEDAEVRPAPQQGAGSISTPPRPNHHVLMVNGNIESIHD